METKVEKNIIIEKDVLEIASMIAREYYLRENSEISPIKMQKSLYFLFAFWAKFTNKNYLENSEISHEEKELFKNTYLFNAEFEAWAYGPVVKEVYDGKEKYLSNNEGNDLEKSDIPKFPKAYLKGMMESIFNTEDFALVNLSHEDECWKKARAKGNNIIIPLEEIFEEYNLKHE